MNTNAPVVRRAGALLAAATIAAGLAACGTGTGDSSGGTTTITLSMQNANVELSDPATWEIVQNFQEQNPDIKIEVSGEPTAQHLQKLTIAAQSDTLPDIFWVYATTAGSLNDDGKLLDLSPMLDDLGIRDNFADSALANFADGDTQFGLPYQGLLTGYYYNKKILADNGLEPPVTFDDLLNIAETLSAKGITTISQGSSQSSFSVWAFLTDLDRFGYEDVYQDILSGDASYDNPDFLRLYEHIAELADAGAFPSNTATQTYQQAVDAFANGEAAMLDSGIWSSSYLQESAIAGDIGFWVGPTYSDGVGEQNIVMNVPSAPFAVSAKVGSDPAKLEAVQKFFAYYYSDEAQQVLVDNGQPPVTTYQAQVDAAKNSVFAAVLEAANGLPSPSAQPDLVVPEPVASAMYDSIYGVIQKQLSPQEALQLVQKAFESNT